MASRASRVVLGVMLDSKWGQKQARVTVGGGRSEFSTYCLPLPPWGSQAGAPPPTSICAPGVVTVAPWD